MTVKRTVCAMPVWHPLPLTLHPSQDAAMPALRALDAGLWALDAAWLRGIHCETHGSGSWLSVNPTKQEARGTTPPMGAHRLREASPGLPPSPVGCKRETYALHMAEKGDMKKEGTSNNKIK